MTSKNSEYVSQLFPRSHAASIFPKLEAQAQLLLSTHLDREQQTLGQQLELRGYEGVIVALR